QVTQTWIGVYSFVACLSRLTIDHASLSRRSNLGHWGRGKTICLFHQNLPTLALSKRSHEEEPFRKINNSGAQYCSHFSSYHINLHHVVWPVLTDRLNTYTD
ncbi:unnamed protein product, partial [Sphacelaria rigidula]